MFVGAAPLQTRLQIQLTGPVRNPTGPVQLDDPTLRRRRPETDPNTDPVNVHAAEWLLKRQKQFQTMFKLLKSWFGGAGENARWGVHTPGVKLPPALSRDPPPYQPPPPPPQQPPPQQCPYENDAFEPAPAPAG